jgi:hypothetical protein
MPGEHGDIWVWWGSFEPGEVFGAMILRREQHALT